MSTPEAEGADARAVRQLLDSARAARSDAFIVLKNGHIIAEWYAGDTGATRTPVQLMSATKSVVGLAIGRLVDDGRITSLDQPVADFYPEWRQGRKRHITVGQLLSHTSGLQDVPSDAPEIAPAPDAVQLALAAELAHDPGTRFFYSNKATNLLAGLVRRASGEPLDVYVRKAILTPLCIANAPWEFRDSAGTPYAMAGLALTARDFAKLGQLMLDRGSWRGTRVVSAAWVEQSVRASQPFDPRYGLLWWVVPEWTRYAIDSALVAEWRRAGVPSDFIARIDPIVGREYTPAAFAAALDTVVGTRGRGLPALFDATQSRDAPARRILAGPPRGFSANGSLGQYLVVLPDARLVVVRQRRRRPDHTATDGFADLPRLVATLFPASVPTPALRRRAPTP